MYMSLSMRSPFGPAVDQILDNLYLGNYEGAQDKALLQKKGITHILVAGKFLSKNFPGDFEYCDLPLVDFTSQNLFPYIEEAINFIKKGKVVFVHCAAGVSRSSSIVIAYLMIEHKMRYDDAIEFVRKKRPIISPNLAFRAQLKKIDELLVANEFDYKKLAVMPAPSFSLYSRF